MVNRAWITIDKDAKEYPPRVAVVLTVDGAGYHRDEGFLPALRDMQSDGWCRIALVGGLCSPRIKTLG